MDELQKRNVNGKAKLQKNAYIEYDCIYRKQRYEKLNHMFLGIQTHIVFQTHKVVFKNAGW